MSVYLDHVNNNISASSGNLTINGVLPQTQNANLTSLAALSTVSTGLVKLTNGVASLDTTSYLSSIPIASTSVVGGVMVDGTTINVTNGVLSVLPSSLLPSQTNNGGKYLTTDGTTASWGTSTGTGDVVLSTNAVLTTPNLGTPSNLTLTNATGLPIASGVSGLATGIATFLATPSSANLLAAVTNETGTGALVFANSPTLVTPILGTPSSGVLTSCTGYTFANLTGTPTTVSGYGITNALTTSMLGAASGVAPLGSDSKISSTYLPSYVDDVLEYANFASLPATGETGKIYIAIDTSKVYRWTGSAYLEIATSVSSSDTAVKLAAARSISATGDATWSVNFDGSTNVTSTLTLANVVTAGTGTKLTYNAKGLVTGSSTLTVSDITNISTTYQSLNANLTSLAALSTASTGLVKLTNGTASLDTSSYLVSSGALGTPSSGDLSNATNAVAYGIKTATNTVSVSAATAPTVGQTLVATSATTATWQTVSAGSSLPSQTGNTGKYLTTDGTNASWAVVSGGLTSTAVKTSAYSASSNEIVRCNTSGGAFSVTFPASPLDGAIIGIVDINNTFAINNLTILPNTGKTIEGDITSYVLDMSSIYVSFIYTSATSNWRLLETPTASPTASIGKSIAMSIAFGG